MGYKGDRERKEDMTRQELVNKYHGKFIEVGQVYDYQNRVWDYEVRKVSKVIRENCNPPEELEA